VFSKTFWVFHPEERKVMSDDLEGVKEKHFCSCGKRNPDLFVCRVSYLASRIKFCLRLEEIVYQQMYKLRQTTCANGKISTRLENKYILNYIFR
jgi:hypothetical protein